MTVESAKFRLAKPEEVIEAKGNCLWRGLQKPWDFVNTVFGIANMYLNRTNVLDWDTPLPLKFTRWVSWQLGYAPDHEFIYPLRSFKCYAYQITDAKVMKAFFSIHRNSDLFAPSNTFMRLFHLAEEVFPDTQFVLDDNVLTCTPDKTTIYHQMFSGPMHGDHMKNVIEEEVKAALKEWTESCANGNYINVTAETRLLASKIISRVLLGQKTNNHKLCNSVNFINSYMLKALAGGFTEDDKLLYKQALKDFRDAANAILESEDEIPLFAGKETPTVPQKQSLLISTFFAGQETVASLLTSIIYELGSNDKKKEYLERDTVINLLSRAIHDFPPAYGTPRKCKADICLKYRLEGENFSRKVIFFEGDMISARIMTLAENTKLSEEKDLPHYSKWFPFGAGPHTCPGKNLAVNEVETMLTELKKGYRIKLDPTMGEVKKLGLMTLQYSKDVFACIEKIEG